MKLLWVLSAALLAFVSTLSPVQAQCGARVRKDWDSMTTAEKDTYKGALAAAMDSGSYIKFIEMHTEMQSEMEAHRQCMFIYWHRLLLVVFENMLRGQGSQYACVTVPYYNWVGASNRMLAGTCSSLGDCSTITRELGGYTTGSQRTININGINNSGRCVSQSPLDHFCQSGTVSGSACARCVPRGDWGSASVPSSTSFASVRQQVFNAQNIGQMSPNVEQGCHNNVHANLDGAMGTFASPSEPLFWSHHAMVDALHTIFHKCRVGTQRLTFAQKAAHPVAWTSCAKRDGGTFSPTDVIFAGLMDVRDLGDSSYSYELSGQLADMYNNCDVNNAPITPTAAPQQPGRWGLFDWLRNRWGFGRFGRRLKAQHGWGWWPRSNNQDNNIRGNDCDDNTATNNNYTPTNNYVPATTAPTTSPQYDGNNNNVDVVTVNKETAEEKHVSTWYKKTMATMGGQCPKPWPISSVKCACLRTSVWARQQKITYGNWRKDMESYFGCPKPTNATQSAKQNAYSDATQSVIQDATHSDCHGHAVKCGALCISVLTGFVAASTTMNCRQVVTVLAFALMLTLTDAKQSCGPRVRRNWDAMSTAEKSTYKGALAAAMDTGAYIKFVEIHTEMKSEMEAHKQCMFIYWHRLFLVVFENMLRGQGPKYACVTIPYFNWMEASNKALTGECKSLGDCSPIMKELGGFTGDSQKTVAINGKSVTGICVAEAPLNHFCQSSSKTGAACTRCLPRVPRWHTTHDIRGEGSGPGSVGIVQPTSWEDNYWSSVQTERLVTMRTGENGSNPMEASEDPVIGRYFKGVPNRFADLMDGSDLGSSSYTYEINGLLALMYNTCGGMAVKDHTTRAPVATTISPVAAPNVPTSTLSDRSQEEQVTGSRSFFDWLFGRILPKESRVRRRLSSCRTSTTTKKETIPPAPSSSNHRAPVVIALNLTRSEKRVMNWYNDTMAANGGQSMENIADMERQVCMFHDQCLGGIIDYSDEFKALWGVQEPRCRTIVSAITSGEQKIVDAAWKEKMEAHFGCPHPVNKTVVTNDAKQAV
ncbi:putative domain, di-copper centre [Phytophthora cactorum]|nr:putative domain, di-copper centre [Phytophthora cactorum]